MSSDALPLVDDETDERATLRERVAALEDAVAALREENRELREELSTFKNIANAADAKAERAERALFGKDALNEKKQAIIDENAPVANLVHGDDFKGVAQVREDLEAERAYRDRSLATLRAKLERVADATDVDLNTPEHGDAISRLLFRGPSEVTDRPGKVHERARAILQHPEWGREIGPGKVRFRANAVRTTLSALEAERSDLDAKAVHRAFDKLVVLAEGSPRTVQTDTTREGRREHRRLVVAYTSSEFDEVTDR